MPCWRAQPVRCVQLCGRGWNLSTKTKEAAAGATERFYSAAQLAEELQVTVRAIRLYESMGLIAPQRAGPTRVYTHRDRARLVLILRGKQLGFSLRDVKEYLDLYDTDPMHWQQTQRLLKAVRERIARLESQRVALDQTLVELRGVEEQTVAQLAKMRSGMKAVR